MNQLFGGSLCLTDLIEKAKSGHSAFSKATNGKVYFNMLTWLNEKEDKYGHIMSHQLSSSKEMREKEGTVYVGNSKAIETKSPVKSNDVDDDLSGVKQRSASPIEAGEPADDLPF